MGNAGCCGAPPERQSGKNFKPRPNLNDLSRSQKIDSAEEIREKATLAMMSRNVREFTQLADNYSFEEHYQTIRLIGKGAFGKIWLCKHKQTELECAVKVIKKSKIEDQGDNVVA